MEAGLEAAGGVEKDREQKTELTDDKEAELSDLFAQMGARPKVKTKQDLERWMVDYVSSLPRESHVPPVSVSPNTPVISITGRKPWLTKFNPDQGHEGFTLWKHQLTCLQRENHSDKDMFDAVRSSLQGKAAHILVRLGPGASISDILNKMDSVYGEIETESDVLAEFYGAHQEKNETVADWGCRLEQLLDVAKRQAYVPGNPDEALRNKFWTGLRQELKDVSAYQYDTSTSFDQLRITLRRIEKQHLACQTPSKSPKPTPCKSTQKQETNCKDGPESEMAEMRAMIQQLTAQVKKLTTNPDKPSDQGPTVSNDAYQRGGTQNRGRRGGPYRGRGGSHGNSSDIACFKCGEKGHIAIGCRTRTDHLQTTQFFQNGLGM
ncbi:paraneoplastic antigen Ma3-like [Littorina saxatilis]|uniref:paraneoplastic antigen Ma3-like n=1 Tax=Littorina saxatilis TaxID=31220 RepID=UPI0038B528A3